MALHDDDTGRGASLDTVLAELKRGEIASCYLLCGDEEYRIQDALDKMTTAMIPAAQDRELNLFVTDGDREDIDALCDSLITPPLLPGCKVVVIRNTRIFQSKNVLGPLIGRIRERLEQDPARAVSDFLNFLQITGLQLDDLRDGGWRKIDDDTWRQIVPDDGGEQRENWLPKAVELCAGRAVAPVRERPEESDRLERILTGGMPEGNCLILTAETVDRRKKLFKTISAVGKILSFSKVKGEARQQAAVQEMVSGLLNQGGKKLSSAAWAALGKKTGFDLRESRGAIEKLITYAGERAQIEAADVEAVVGRTKEDSVFDLTGVLAGRKLAPALRTLHELLDQGEAPLKLFSMIVRELRLLFQAKLLMESGRFGTFTPEMDYGRFQKALFPAIKKLNAEGEESIAIASQHPFVVYQSLKNAGRFTRAELVGYLEQLVRTDLAFKTTGNNPILLLERILIMVCKVKAS
jgi:DNA polymerase-3 subunit delta